MGGVSRFKDVPADASSPALSETDKQLVMHIELVITGDHHLMGTDAPESMGLVVHMGNNVHINLEPDTRAEADRLFHALSQGGTVTMPLQDMFWGGYYGSCTDKFGVQWMVHVRNSS